VTHSSDIALAQMDRTLRCAEFSECERSRLPKGMRQHQRRVRQTARAAKLMPSFPDPSAVPTQPSCAEVPPARPRPPGASSHGPAECRSGSRVLRVRKCARPDTDHRRAATSAETGYRSVPEPVTTCWPASPRARLAWSGGEPRLSNRRPERRHRLHALAPVASCRTAPVHA
jgi:hypothetical protein